MAEGAFEQGSGRSESYNQEEVIIVPEGVSTCKFSTQFERIAVGLISGYDIQEYLEQFNDEEYDESLFELTLEEAKAIADATDEGRTVDNVIGIMKELYPEFKDIEILACDEAVEVWW